MSNIFLFINGNYHDWIKWKAHRHEALSRIIDVIFFKTCNKTITCIFYRKLAVKFYLDIL